MTYTVEHHSTPNKSARIGAPSFFVMHVTEGGFEGAVSWLCNPAAQASADEVINLDGSRVAVLNTPDTREKTWAVGNGNSQSMSFENEGHGGVTHWPTSHYDTLADRLIKAQKHVKTVYGVSIPLRRTTSPHMPGICGHGDMAHWFGGSDHFTCPGTTFDYHALQAAIDRKLAPPNPVLTTRTAQWQWARWYLGIGEYEKFGPRNKHHRPNVPQHIVGPQWWGKAIWYKLHVAKAK